MSCGGNCSCKENDKSNDGDKKKLKKIREIVDDIYIPNKSGCWDDTLHELYELKKKLEEILDEGGGADGSS